MNHDFKISDVAKLVEDSKQAIEKMILQLPEEDQKKCRQIQKEVKDKSTNEIEIMLKNLKENNNAG